MFGLALCGIAGADSITFSILPEGDITATPGSTVGWGYAIENTTPYYLLPTGLSSAGFIYGIVDDIFDYPVVEPGIPAYQEYAYNAPGGFGNSLGLYEYTLPLDAPHGSLQSGTFSLSYQLYDRNPDLDAEAAAVGAEATLSAAFSLMTIAGGGSVSFSAVPSAIMACPGSTVGWGYAIENSTAYYALPIGLSSDGITYGSIVDIFFYPVIEPGVAMLQAYSYSAPGGFGNSVGLYEYPVPTDTVSGSVQSGNFYLSYQLYSANPDIDWNAAPIGDPVTVASSFELTASTAAVPEPTTLVLFCVGLSVMLLNSRAAKSRTRPQCPRW
jgi:hypothetical protein